VPREIPIRQGIAILSLVQALTSTAWYVTLVLMVDRAALLLARPSVRRWITGASAVGLLLLATGLLLAPRR
jgi:threonine/homoserine/homoserine lactone efflux protein